MSKRLSEDDMKASPLYVDTGEPIPETEESRLIALIDGLPCINIIAVGQSCDTLAARGSKANRCPVCKAKDAAHGR